MKIRRVRDKVHRLFAVPPYVLSDFLNIDDLVMLRRTHPFFVSGKLCQVASPIINIFGSEPSPTYIQFPKAKYVYPGPKSYNFHIKDPTILSNITSANLSHSFIQPNELSQMTNLISLRLNDCEFIKTIDIGLWLTKLVSLSLNSNSQINGSALAKLICLRKLNLDNNTCISDLDIESLPLESLSLVGNYRITDSIFRKLKLTQVGLSVGSPAATDEILRCTTITDLNLKGTNMDYICYIPTFAKMTNLRKLIAVDYYSTEDVFKYLTNLTYLELPYSGNDRGIDVGIAGLPLLGTLVIDKIYDRYFPKVPLDSLSHLEIRGDRYKINLQFVRNLTFLDVGPGWINQELHDLKNLKKLVLRNVGYCCDISRLSELTSLTVLDDTSKHCVINHSLFVSDSLQSLCIHAYRCFMYGASFRAVPNLKYLSVCALDVRIDSSSFNNLDKLFSIVVREHQVDKKLLASLRKEGIMVRDSFYMGPGEPRYSDFFDKLA